MFNLKEWKEVKLGDLPSLLKLTMDSCPELDSLPSLSRLKSLKHLEFRRCPKLLSLPSDGLPTSLESFIVIDCPELKEWCRKVEGEDRSKIYHVPSIWFDCEETTLLALSVPPVQDGRCFLVDISEENMELDG
ncbi:hypothetical protein M0R45_027279 [Rubus argutus]|uniref:CC-NBS-LRR protein n=1 Tax=Rubus argutus TaxID=59490 RepID=A0AAW1X1N5_RUBAR